MYFTVQLLMTVISILKMPENKAVRDGFPDFKNISDQDTEAATRSEVSTMSR